MTLRYHKRIRLDAPAYATPGAICSVTMAVRDRRPIFGHSRVAAAAVQVLKQRAAATRVQVFSYCIMPDHVHLVLQPSPTCDIVTFAAQFKNLAQRAAWKLGVEGPFWQKSFWDHFLRKDEDVRQVVEYVLGNPVRAGLVTEWKQYPFSGSLVFAL